MPKMTFEEMIEEGIKRRRRRLMGETITGIIKTQTRLEDFTADFFRNSALPNAYGLSDEQMQQIADEMGNYDHGGGEQ